jgi:hypothetical protein
MVCLIVVGKLKVNSKGQGSVMSGQEYTHCGLMANWLRLDIYSALVVLHAGRWYWVGGKDERAR